MELELIPRLVRELEEKKDFSFMDDGDYDNLGSCFSFEEKHLGPGESIETGGTHIGIVLRGQGTYTFHGRELPGKTLTVFGMEYTEMGLVNPLDTSFTAEEPCDIIWAEYPSCAFVCYAACWYHRVFIREIKELYSRQHGQDVLQL